MEKTYLKKQNNVAGINEVNPSQKIEDVEYSYLKRGNGHENKW